MRILPCSWFWLRAAHATGWRQAAGTPVPIPDLDDEARLNDPKPEQWDIWLQSLRLCEAEKWWTEMQCVICTTSFPKVSGQIFLHCYVCLGESASLEAGPINLICTKKTVSTHLEDTIRLSRLSRDGWAIRRLGLISCLASFPFCLSNGFASKLEYQDIPRWTKWPTVWSFSDRPRGLPAMLHWLKPLHLYGIVRPR